VSFVLDSAVALTWCFEDERTPETQLLLQRVVESGAIVPVLWPLEVLNALATAERRRRLDRDSRHTLARSLKELPIRLDLDSAAAAWTDTAALAERHQLTLYDASYLELAIRLGLPIGTLEEALRKAAQTLDVPVLGKAQ